MTIRFPIHVARLLGVFVNPRVQRGEVHVTDFFSQLGLAIPPNSIGATSKEGFSKVEA